jgi:hypothetical protein
MKKKPVKSKAKKQKNQGENEISMERSKKKNDDFKAATKRMIDFFTSF